MNNLVYRLSRAPDLAAARALLARCATDELRGLGDALDDLDRLPLERVVALQTEVARRLGREHCE